MSGWADDFAAEMEAALGTDEQGWIYRMQEEGRRQARPAPAPKAPAPQPAPHPDLGTDEPAGMARYRTLSRQQGLTAGMGGGDPFAPDQRAEVDAIAAEVPQVAAQEAREAATRQGIQENLKGAGTFATAMGGVLAAPGAMATAPLRIAAGAPSSAPVPAVKEAPAAASFADEMVGLLKSSPESGKSLHGGPLGQAVAGAVEHFQYAPKLRKYASSDPSVMLDDLYALNRSAANSSVETAAEKARSLQHGMTETEKHAMSRYLMAKDQLERMRTGIAKVAGGKDEAALRTEMSAALAQIDEKRLAEFEGGYRAWGDEVFDRLVAAGQIDPERRREFYAPHLVKDYYDEAGQAPGGVAKGVSQTKPGQTREVVGSEREIESDPYRAMAFADHLSRKAVKDSEFRKEVLGKYAVKGPFNVREHALYSFGPGKPQIIVGPQAENMAKAGELSIGNRKFDILPRELAEGMAEAGGGLEMNALRKALATTGQVSRTTQLLLSPQFQLSQWPADFTTALANIPVHKIPAFAGSYAKNAKALAGAYADRAQGKFSTLLEGLRDRGILTETFESLLDNADPAHVISAKAVPGSLRGGGVRTYLGRAKDAVIDPIKTVGAFRETALKAAMVEVFESMGATGNRAAVWANRTLGNYFKSSKSGRALGLNVQFSKWFVEQMLRLTVDIAKDPATGKNSLRGLASGPAPKIAAYAILQNAVNTRDPETAELAANLPARKSAAFVIGKSEDGKTRTVQPDTLVPLFNAMLGTLLEAKNKGVGAAAESVLDSVAQRANPLWRAAYSAKTGNRPGGGPMDPKETEGMSTRAKKGYNAKRGGLPFLTPAGQEYAEMAGGALLRLPRQIRDQDSSKGGFANLLARLGGYEEMDITDRVAEEAGGDVKIMLQRWVDARDSDDADAEEEALQWLVQHGWDHEALSRHLAVGARNEIETTESTAEERKQKKRQKLTPYDAPGATPRGR